METQKIQATLTLTLTQEQLPALLSLLSAAPAQTATPAMQQPPNPNFVSAGQIPAQQTPTPMPQAIPQQNQIPVQQMQPMAMPQAVPQQAQPIPMPQQAQPIPAQQMQPTAIPQQTAPQTYSVQDLSLAARPLMESGRQQELIGLLAEFGVQSVAAIPENRRAEFASRLRALGGQI